MTTDSCFQMPCKTEMALLNPDCGFLPPPIKKRKKNPTLGTTSDCSACEMCGGSNGLAWSEGEGSRQAPNPRCRGQVLPHFPGPLGPTIKDSGRRRLQSALQFCNWRARAGFEQVPPPFPCHSLPLITPTSFLFLSPQNEDMLDTPCASPQSLIPKIVSRKRNTCMKLLLLHLLSFTLWAQKPVLLFTSVKEPLSARRLTPTPRLDPFWSLSAAEHRDSAN